jgi:hypothetical protein
MKVFKNYQGQSIRINGQCYNFIGDVTDPVNTSPNDIEGAFGSCLECEVEESTSSSSESIGNESSSTSSGNYSESTSESSEGYTTSSSESSESIGNVSTSTSSDSTQSESSESINNFSSSSESFLNESSSQSDGCVSVEILDIITNQKLVFSPLPLGYLPEGQVCINGIDNSGYLDTGGLAAAIQMPDTSNYYIGQVVEVCEGECCYKGNYTRQCIYSLNEVTGIWELTGSSDGRNNSCNLDFKCTGGSNTVAQTHQFGTLEQRNAFSCPASPIGSCESNWTSTSIMLWRFFIK